MILLVHDAPLSWVFKFVYVFLLRPFRFLKAQECVHSSPVVKDALLSHANV